MVKNKRSSSRVRMVNFQGLIMLMLPLVSGDVQVFLKSNYVIDPPGLIEIFEDRPSDFGDSIVPGSGISALFVYANPPLACGKITSPPTNYSNPYHKWGVLIKRGNCTYRDKIFAAQAAGYSVAIVHNVDSNEIVSMTAFNAEDIIIPSVFIGSYAGTKIKEKFLYENYLYFIRIVANSGYDYTKTLILFLIIISMIMVVMIVFMVFKCIQDYRRTRRHRLPHSVLNKIPTAKFRRGDPYETCAICLDDFIESEKLRILPCSHAYHCKCIDPWLTGNRRVCPMCKRKVFTHNHTVVCGVDDSDSDDDNTPLLRNSHTPGGGTFNEPSMGSQDSRIMAEIRAAVVNDIRAHHSTETDDSENTSDAGSARSNNLANRPHAASC